MLRNDALNMMLNDWF